MAESDPNMETALTRLEAALGRLATLAEHNAARSAAVPDPTPDPARNPGIEALAAGLDRLIARLRAVLAEAGG